MQNLRIAVVGASLGGLSIANVAHRLGAKVSVWEVFPSGFHLRGGALGSVDTELLQSLRGDSDESFRKGIRSHGHFYGDLWSYLYEGLPEGTVRFGMHVERVVGQDTDTPALVFSKPPDISSDNKQCNDAFAEPVPFDLIIGADGGRSTIRGYVTPQEPTYSG
mmetsp:Transcript_14703/g.20831  ORF Transcript_14703/g.20831 Transcript_14703/m.20831 type:complete len:163 (-) Transcript_14703:14-502(-)